jgi:hypothetical protein
MAVFDTLAYARRLRQAGFSEEQAEVQAEALAAVVNDTLATKQDLRDLATKQDLRELQHEVDGLRREIAELGRTTKQDLGELARTTQQDLGEFARTTQQNLGELARTTQQNLGELARTNKQDLREVEYRLTVRLGTMLTVAVGALAALVKLL